MLGSSTAERDASQQHGKVACRPATQQDNMQVFCCVSMFMGEQDNNLVHTCCVTFCYCLQDRDGSIRKLKALVKSTAEKASKEKAEAAAQPMEASQRAVIRDLSLRVANLTRLNNQLKEERERAQVSDLQSLSAEVPCLLCSC